MCEIVTIISQTKQFCHVDQMAEMTEKRGGTWN